MKRLLAVTGVAVGATLALYGLEKHNFNNESLETREIMQPSQSTSRDILRVYLGTSTEAPYSKNVSTGAMETFLSLVLGQLVYSSGNYEATPGLLESAKFNFDVGAYDLRLPKGLRFHNGREATSADLEFSLVHHLLGEYGTWFRTFFGGIKGVADFAGAKTYRPGLISGISVVDSRTVRVRLNSPNPFFLHSIARSFFSLVPQESMVEPDYRWRKHPIGAGAYEIVREDFEQQLTVLRKVSLDHAGPSEIHVYMKPIADPDVCFSGVTGKCSSLKSLGICSGVTLLNFNFSNRLALDESFRQRVRDAIRPEETEFDPRQLTPTDQLLPRHFWGRARNLKRPRSPVAATGPRVQSRLLYYDTGALSENFFSFLKGVQRQLATAGIDVELVRETHKYDRSKSGDFFGEVSTLGADVVDPLILYEVFREGSPLHPYVPPRDEDFEEAFKTASESLDTPGRDAAFERLASVFESKNFAITLFERTTSFAINPDRVASIGTQNGSLIVYLDRMVLR